MFCTKCGKNIDGDRFGTCEACGGLRLSDVDHSAPASKQSTTSYRIEAASRPLAKNTAEATSHEPKSSDLKYLRRGCYLITSISPLRAGVCAAMIQFAACMIMLPILLIPFFLVNLDVAGVGKLASESQIAIALMPIAIGTFFVFQIIMAFFIGVVVSGVYNIVARLFGGLEICLTSSKLK